MRTLAVFSMVIVSFVSTAVGDQAPNSGNTENEASVEVSPLQAEVNIARSMAERNGSRFVGYEVELAKQISQEIGRPIELRTLTNPDDYFEAARNGSADMVFGGLTITADREESGLDFSHPTFDSGLSIAIRWDHGKEAGSRIMAVIEAFFTWVTVPMLLLLSFLCALGAAQLKKKESSSTLLAGAVGTIVILLGVGINASVQYNLQEQDSQTAEISSPQDLDGLRVVTKRNTTSIDRLHELGADVVEADSFEEAVEQLLADEEIDALVFDSPVVWDYEAGEGYGRIKVVGEQFDHQKYGFAFKENNEDLREAVNRALLKLERSGEMARLRARFFGLHH